MHIRYAQNRKQTFKKARRILYIRMRKSIFYYKREKAPEKTILD